MRKLILICLPVAALLVAAAVALGAVSTTFQVIVSPAKASTKKKVRPISLAVNLSTADPALAQPPPLKKVVIRLNKGGIFNGKLFPKCTSAKLLAKGVKGCPKGSKIGTGTAKASAKPIIDLVNAKMTIFNGPTQGGKSTVLLYNVPDISSPIVVSGTVEKKPAVSCANGAGQCDYVLTFDVPDIPTLPNAPPASVLEVKTKSGGSGVFIRKKRHGKKVKIPYIGAPKKCTGKWVADLSINFGDGQTATNTSTASCKK